MNRWAITFLFIAAVGAIGLFSLEAPELQGAKIVVSVSLVVAVVSLMLGRLEPVESVN